MTDALAEETLRAFLAAELEAVITELTRIKGGYSREMWSFDAWPPGGPSRSLIFCADSATSVVGSGEQALSRPQEAALLACLHGQGLPVPDALCSGDQAGAIGRDYLVMERKSGTAVIGPLSRDPWYTARRPELGKQLATMLARLHAAAVPDSLLGARPTGAEVAPRALRQWSAEVDATPQAQTPVIRQALRWMAGALPPAPEQVTLVHGDFRTGNVLHGYGDAEERDGFRTLLDWEMAHFGDPLEDLAWAQLACWRVGTGRVGALVNLPEWGRLYADAAGRPVDPEALRWWEVLGSVKMSCLMKRAAAVTAGQERDLLERLFEVLGDELAAGLLPDHDVRA